MMFNIYFYFILVKLVISDRDVIVSTISRVVEARWVKPFTNLALYLRTKQRCNKSLPTIRNAMMRKWKP